LRCAAWAPATGLGFGSGIGGPTLHMARVTGTSFLGASNNERLNAGAQAGVARAGLAG
jgi:tocopherol O-methyltransferase